MRHRSYAGCCTRHARIFNILLLPLPEAFYLKQWGPYMKTTELREIFEQIKNLDLKYGRLEMYSRALEFAILYHCSGEQIPDDIAEIIPQYARYLNGSGCCTSEQEEKDDPLDVICPDVNQSQKEEQWRQSR